MKTQHTPGPWFVERDGSWPYIVGEEGLVRVADVCEDRGVIGPKRAAANARLIAKAPELYRLIEELLERHPGGDERSMCHVGVTSMEKCSTCSVVLKANTLLAEIRGES